MDHVPGEVFYYSAVLGILHYVFVSANRTCSLKEIIPEDYKNTEAPKNNGKAVDVYVAMRIRDIYDLDETTMDFHIHMFFQDYWMDQRLHLDCLKSIDNKAVIVPLEIQKMMWEPDIYFENSISGKLFQITLPNLSIKILPNGFIYRYARYDLRINCPMDLHLYPLDKQICTIRIALFSFPDDMVALHWLRDPDSPDITDKKVQSLYYDSVVQLPQFRITNTSTDREVVSWNTGNYTTLKAIFVFDRMVTAHLINTYIPSTLVVMLSWLSFWLDVEAVPARITLGVTSLLTLATQVVQSRKNLPPVSYINAMDVWLFVSVNMVFATLVEYAISYYMANYAEKKFGHWLLLWKQKFMLIKNLEIDDMKKPSQRGWVGTYRITCKKSTDNNSENKVVTKKVQSLDRICRKIFPIIFFMFVIIYWIYFGIICQ